MTAANSNAEPESPRRIFNGRVVVLLVALLVAICAGVMLADYFSIRDRHLNAAPAVKGSRP